MKGFGAVLVAISLILLVLEHLNLVDVVGIVGLLVGLFAIISHPFNRNNVTNYA